MSWHLSHRLTTVHRAVSMALLYSIGYAALSSSVQAATIGKTVITSAQHEPLAASITVTDIKATDFSASLANATIYQQMGLTPTDSMSLRFQPTSATSGQLFISTTQPVSKPFADVVLAINDNGQRKVIPKTLLMPLDNNIRAKPFNNLITAAKKPNLPIVSTNNAQPLTVRQGTPPPLLSAPIVQTVNVQTANVQASTQTLSLPAAKVSAPPAHTAANTSQRRSISHLDNGQLNTSPNISSNDRVNSANDNNNSAVNNLAINSTVVNETASTNSNAMAADNRSSGTAATDKQFDILNIQVIRQIQPSNAINAKTTTTQQPPIPMLANDDSASTVKPESSNTTATKLAPTKIDANASVTASTTDTSSATVNYTVQQNDNLWIIAQQIAQKNNLNIQTVMTQIQSQNPDAFINKEPGQLKADAQLHLPDYEVVPSQQSLQAAISAQRQYSQQASAAVVKKTMPPKPAPKVTTQTPSETTQVAKSPEKPATTMTKTLPKARFSVLAPGRDGRADGTQTKAAAATGNGLSTDILATLKSSRQRTADQAQHLTKTNRALGSYTRKLQLQNQKLAELQAHLKKLRNQ